MIRFLRHAFALGLLSSIVLLIFIPSFAVVQNLLEPKKFAPADVIMVFGAGMDVDGTLHRPTRLRVARAVTLYQQGVAPRLHMSGGMAREGGLAAGNQMRDLAVTLGVPRNAITSETHSLSTLQNALFSLPNLPQTGRIIAVSEGFHLPRVWASLHWAAMNDKRSFDVALSNSEPFRGTASRQRGLVYREVLAIGFNTLRAAAWQVGGIIGTENRDDLLK